jgi:hypothetical protein
MTDADGLLVNVVLPLVGLFLLAFCVLAFFLPYGQRFSNARQKVKAFGIDLEVSALTLFVLAALAMLFTGVYIRLTNFEGRVISLQQELENLKNGQVLDVTWRVTLEGVEPATMPNLRNLRGRMVFGPTNQERSVPISLGRRNTELVLILQAVTRDLYIDTLEIIEQPDAPNIQGRVWRIDNVRAIEPRFTFQVDR